MKETVFSQMDRGRFLRGLFGNAALLTLPLKLLPEQNRAPRTVPVLEANVRGFGYHEGPQLIHRIRVGDALELVREPENEFDGNAIAVHWDKHHIGYLPREENATLARMMDRGVPLECAVVRTRPEAKSWEQCFIAVHLRVPRM